MMDGQGVISSVRRKGNAFSKLRLLCSPESTRDVRREDENNSHPCTAYVLRMFDLIALALQFGTVVGQHCTFTGGIRHNDN